MSWKCSECGFENTDDSISICVCGAEYLEPTEKKYNPKLMYSATFLVAVVAALMFWTWDWRFLFIALPASFWAHRNRPTSKSEREKLEDFSNKTFAYS